MSQIQQVSAQDFSREVFFSPVPVVVDVYTDWCGPCRALTQLLERVAEHFAGRVKFVKMNIDEDPDVAEMYRIQGVPTLLFFHDGELVDRVVGLADPRGLVAKVEQFAGPKSAARA